MQAHQLMSKSTFPLALGIAFYSVSMLSQPVHAETYKIRISGEGNAYWTGAANGYAIINIDSNNKVTIKQTTLVSNMITGFGKWWDHAVTASRACPLQANEWESTENCIVGDQDQIQIPQGSSPRNYSYEFKWSENGATQRAVVDLKKAVPAKN